MARSSTTLSKGVSGDPSGGPPVVAEVRDAAREHTSDAVAVLAGIMNDETAPHAARVSAANALLDRGHGRAVATVNAIVGKGDPVAAIMDAIAGRSRHIPDAEKYNAERKLADEDAVGTA